MLAEFGAIGALIAGYLIFRQLGMVFGWSDNVVYGLTGAATVGYGLYCKSLGRPLLIFMCIIMIPLATTELGTDGAISGLMEEPMKEAGYNGLWVLIYTSAIMMVLRSGLLDRLLKSSDLLVFWQPLQFWRLPVCIF